MLRLLPAALAAALLAACADGAPTASSATALDEDGEGPIRIALRDDCEPTSFNAALGPGTCAREGETTFEAFIAELTAKRSVRAWRIIPRQIAIQEGWRIRVTNLGGEVHTFTEVERFGGGIVPSLNALAGTPDVAPECLQLGADDFLSPGGSFTFVEGEEEDASAAAAPESDHVEKERYQCCIHPWMRSLFLVSEQDAER